MCGRSTEKHGVALVAIREAESNTDSGNPFLRCEECNAAAGDYFERDPAWMGAVIAHKSVHVRLGETLKAFKGEPVPAATLNFVASQGDWKKRIRELRYLGWEIETFNRQISETRISSFYRLVKWRPWPPDPTAIIRQYERERAERNSAERD